MASTECNQFEAMLKSEVLPMNQNSFDEQLKNIESEETQKSFDKDNSLLEMLEKLQSFQKQLGDNQIPSGFSKEKQEGIKKLFEQFKENLKISSTLR